MSSDAVALKQEVKEYWNRASCDTWHTQAQKFSREYFEDIEERRYRLQGFIHWFAQFTRYHGKKVLEVGFGAGTDFVQWLRAGAIVSGIDLTEEALDNLRHRIDVYRLPAPADIRVADAENLPFESNTFDLGYSFGVLFLCPDFEKALAELVRVVRPGGEIKVMIYNRHSLCVLKAWVKFALLRGCPWKSFRWVVWNHVESIGNKAYTVSELKKIFGSLEVRDVTIRTFLTHADRMERKQFPYWIADLPLAFLASLTGSRLGWFHCVTAKKTAPTPTAVSR